MSYGDSGALGAEEDADGARVEYGYDNYRLEDKTFKLGGTTQFTVSYPDAPGALVRRTRVLDAAAAITREETRTYASLSGVMTSVLKPEGTLNYS